MTDFNNATGPEVIEALQEQAVPGSDIRSAVIGVAAILQKIECQLDRIAEALEGRTE